VGLQRYYFTIIYGKTIEQNKNSLKILMNIDRVKELFLPIGKGII
jgi:hypothetical protein